MAIHPTREHRSNLTVHQRIVARIAIWAGHPYAVYISLAISLTSLPAVLATHSLVNFILWLSGTCTQLVMLFVLQSNAIIDGSHSEEQSNAIYEHAVTSEKQNEEILSRLDRIENKLTQNTASEDGI